MSEKYSHFFKYNESVQSDLVTHAVLCLLPFRRGTAETIDSGIDTNATAIGRMGVISLVSHMRDFGHGIPETESAVHVKGAWVDGSMMPSRL